MTILNKPELTENRIDDIRTVIEQNPDANRTKLSQIICKQWGWQTPKGQAKDIACRDMLRALDKAGVIVLPAPQKAPVRRGPILHLAHEMAPIECRLKELLPLDVQIADDKNTITEFKSFIDQFHYLGFNRTVGENLKYIVRSSNGNIVSCLLFGSAAWACRARDSHIGWDKKRRSESLHLLTNNVRFLIPQWVRVPYLASHVLSIVMRRISEDWSIAYGHPLLAVETFVDTSRFRGVCYRSANWIYVGRTTGRGRNGGHHNAVVPEKDIYLYPLDKEYCRKLRGDVQ